MYLGGIKQRMGLRFIQEHNPVVKAQLFDAGHLSHHVWLIPHNIACFTEFRAFSP